MNLFRHPEKTVYITDQIDAKIHQGAAGKLWIKHRQYLTGKKTVIPA
jgi:hypothetical protein